MKICSLTFSNEKARHPCLKRYYSGERQDSAPSAASKQATAQITTTISTIERIKMHTTKVTNFPHANSGTPFATVTVNVDSTRHITTTMSENGSEVTIFFDSPAEIRQFASDLLTQASTKENQ